MQDLDDGVRVGRGRLSAISGEAATKVRPFLDDIPVVPGPRLLAVASALSDGATLMHARLRHLDPDERDAILDMLAGQLSGIVGLWADLVRDVVPTADADRDPTPETAPRSETRPRTESHPSAQRPTLTDGRRRGEATVAGPAVGSAPAAQPGPGPGPEPGPGVRLLPRREPQTPGRPAETAHRELWATPLRSVKVAERDGDPAGDPDSAYEGDRLTRDELTGVLNRQAGFAALGRDLDRCRRAGERFVIGYLDVDGLKDVNSTAGSRAGDELLRKVTAALRATLRSYDVIMRLGGDEFLFSLPGADMATAELRANEFGVILAEESRGGSASIGFAELGGDDTLDEIISRAETELVKNRRAGVRRR
ncbi:MAG TPA: GGDEF domain-containing protein [Acidimicrobiales bacterium]|nr:GGDEF domain-containing protein [Acidimicrobiales bacterium]